MKLIELTEKEMQVIEGGSSGVACDTLEPKLVPKTALVAVCAKRKKDPIKKITE